MIALDHLIIAAATLDEGVDYVADTLGIAPSGGGCHELVGTHNKVLRLGHDVYLEVIALDPAGITPTFLRWIRRSYRHG